MSISASDSALAFTSDGTQQQFSSYGWVAKPRSILGCSFSVKVSATAPGSDVDFAVRFVDPTSNGMTYVGFSEQHGTLSFADYLLAAGAQPPSEPYDAVAHAYWRLSESGGMLSWDTSPDGTIWTSLRSEPTPDFASAGAVLFAVGQLTASAPSTVTFSELH